MELSPLCVTIIKFLDTIRVHDLGCSTEAKLEDKLYSLIKQQIKTKKLSISIQTQDRTHLERVMRPDIILGENNILIEIKYLDKSVNDIYRLFYQAVKYSKIAKEAVILFVFDPNSIFKSEDKKDIESLLPKVKVIHKL